MNEPVTGIALIDAVLALIGTYGYPIVFVAVVLENVFLVGGVIPGETIVVATAFVAASGRLNVALVFVLAVVAGVIGCNISYAFGRRWGRAGLERYGRRFHIERRLDAAEEYFSLHGSKTVFLSRFASGVKSFGPTLAGVAHMPLPWFEGWAFLGAVAYTTLLVAVGWFFGENFQAALAFLRDLGYGALAVLAGVVALVVWKRRRDLRRIDELAEASDEEAAASARAQGSADRGDEDGDDGLAED